MAYTPLASRAQTEPTYIQNQMSEYNTIRSAIAINNVLAQTDKLIRFDIGSGFWIVFDQTTGGELHR